MSTVDAGSNVAIVGGGFTGLTAAYKLSEKGINVTVFEAGDNVGGLASGCELLGVPVEKAYHFLYKTDKYMLTLLDELGLRDKLTYHKSSVSTYYDGKLYPMESPVDLINFKPLSLINRIRAGVSVLFLQRVKNWDKLTKLTAMEWLNRYAGKQVTDVIWEPLLRGKFDHYFDKVTMCWLWGRIKQRVESRDSELKGEALGYVEGGFVAIIDRLTEELAKKGGKIAINSPVLGIKRNNSSGSIAVETKAGVQQFDKVLLTTPCGVADKLLTDYTAVDPAYFEKLNSIDYLDAAVLLFATDKPISHYYWHNINTPNSSFVVFLSLTSLIGTDRFQGKHVYYIGDYVPSGHHYMSDSAEDLENKWFDALAQMFPEFDRHHVLESKVFRFKDAQHIVDVGFEDKIVPHRTPCDGVFLCNFSQIFPMDRGTNYAVRDGYRMSELIENELREN